MTHHPFYPGGNPRMNHVAMSLPADSLGEATRADLSRYFEAVLGFTEMPTMTEDRKQMIFSCVHWDQFIFLIAEDDPMACPRMDHYGFSVSSREELDAANERALEFQRGDDRVQIVGPEIDDQGMVKIHSVYFGYLLPMMVELQYWEFT